jgi:hypothetical protein
VSELRRTGWKTAHGGDPGIWRIGPLDGTSGQTVEDERQRPIAFWSCLGK